MDDKEVKKPKTRTISNEIKERSEIPWLILCFSTDMKDRKLERLSSWNNPDVCPPKMKGREVKKPRTRVISKPS